MFTRSLIVCLTVLVGTATLASPSHPGEAGVLATVLENDADRIVIQFDLLGYGQTPIDIGGADYTQLSVRSEPSTHDVGAPELPYLVRSIALETQADSLSVTVDQRRSSFVEQAAVSIVPSKGHLPRTVDPESVPYTFGPAYETDTFYPGTLATTRDTYVLRDIHGVPVVVYPFQYNPVTQTLRVYTTLTVVVTPRASGAVSPPQGRAERKLSRAFHQLYRSRFINYVPPQRYVPLDEDGDLLIICHDPWIPNMQPLVAHKTARGINTTIVGVSTIGNNPTSIKSYIQSVYDNSDLAFVLLVGDAAQVATPTAHNGASDPSYSKLAGPDDYPDIMVGRFSAESPAQVDTQVQRTIAYENLPATAQDWFWKATGIASAQGAGKGDEGQADWQHMDEIRLWLLAAGYTEVDQIYDTNGGTAADVSAAVDAGRGLINYCGHGTTTTWTTTGFSNSDVNALVNVGMLPFVHSVACVNGNFDGPTCFAEAWMRATYDAQPTGAIGIYASSINQDWAPPMEGQDEFNLLYTDPAEPYHAIGTLCYAGACSMMDDYGSDGVKVFNTWHLFGDPTLAFVGVPTGLKVSPKDGFYAEGLVGGPFVPESTIYTLENLDDTPIDFLVNKTADWLEVSPQSGTIDAHDSTQITVSISAPASALSSGRYQDTLWILNMSNHDGDTSRVVNLRVGIPQPVYTWSLDSDPGWTRNGEWAFGRPTGQGGGVYGYPDPTSGVTGDNVVGVNLDGNYTIALDGAHYVTLGPLDLTAITETSLRFQRWLNSDFQPWVSATVEVSANGTDWVQLWSNGEVEFAENTWTPQQLDAWDVADNEPAVWFRWGYRVHRMDAVAYSGWNIDDIEVWGLDANAPVGCKGDANCDRTINWRDIDYFVAAMDSASAWADMFAPDAPNCPYTNNDVDNDGTVSWHDIDPLVARMNMDCN